MAKRNSTTAIIERFLHGRRIRLPVEDPDEYLQSHWARGEIYEHELYGTGAVRHALGSVVSVVSRRVRGHERLGMLGFIEAHHRGGTFVDVGACIGNHSLFFAVACDARVIAFEPVPELASHFREVMALNGLDDRVELIESAVGDREGTVRFRRASKKNVGMGRVSDLGEEMRVTTIDRCVSSIDDVKLVKIDVEGYNLPVLRGARETLAKHKPVVFIECDGDLPEVEREFTEHGYVRRADLVFNKTPTYLFEPR